MRTPDFEQEIGIDTYCTNQPGIGGKVRVYIDDFHVIERFVYPPKKDQGNFTIAEVTSRNWETHLLVQEIAHRLQVSQRRISFAGTKDKRARTTQLMSFHHINPDKLTALSIKDVSINSMYQSDIPVRIGNLLGNHFEITIRDIPVSINEEHIESLITPFRTWGGFPNFYGIQRFGVIRSITHRVGKLIVQGDFEKAAMTYIGNPMKGENEVTYRLRTDLEKTRDYKKAFHSYPSTLSFEKAMLNRLIQDPDDYIGSFQQLPKNLLLMFVNAYESFVFNKILSERIMNNIPIHRAILGDIIAPVRKNVVSPEFISVDEANIEKVNKQISKRKAVVTGLLIGYDTIIAKGEMGEIEHKIIESQRIDPRDFIIPEIPFLSSKGSRRPLLSLMPQLDWALHEDKDSKETQAVTIRFELQKGCYATALLREIMKSNDPKNY